MNKNWNLFVAIINLFATSLYGVDFFLIGYLEAYQWVLGTINLGLGILFLKLYLDERWLERELDKLTDGE